MRKTVTAAVALVAMAAIFVALASGGTHSTKQRVRIEVKGADPYAFALKPISHGRMVRPDTGTANFCCWTTRYVTRAGTKLIVNDPHLELTGAHGTLKIRERIVWIGLPDDWSVCTGTWKVTGGTGAYAGLSGHGRVGCASGRLDLDKKDVYLRIRLFGWLEST